MVAGDELLEWFDNTFCGWINFTHFTERIFTRPIINRIIITKAPISKPINTNGNGIIDWFTRIGIDTCTQRLFRHTKSFGQVFVGRLTSHSDNKGNSQR
jgi:hypothetical protein